MATKVLARALRGFQSAFGLPGQETAPGAIEFGLPIQCTADATQLARYGAAARGDLADGWILWRNDLSMLTGVGIYTTSIQLSTLIGLAGLSDPARWNYWIYSCAISVVASAAVADWDSAMLSIGYPDANSLGPGVGQELPFFYGNSGATYTVIAGTIFPRAQNGPTPPSPICMPPGSNLRISSTQDAAAGTLVTRTVVLGRILPVGVPPLP